MFYRTVPYIYVFQMKKTILLWSNDETREINSKLNRNLKLYLNKGVNQVFFYVSLVVNFKTS